MTTHQSTYLDFIRHFQQDNRYSPSLRDLSLHFDCSLTACGKTVTALVEAGHLTRAPNGRIGFDKLPTHPNGRIKKPHIPFQPFVVSMGMCYLPRI